MIPYTPEGLASLTGEELLRHYRMEESSLPRGHLRNRVARAELEAHDTAMTMLRKEIGRRMKVLGIYAVDDGLGNAYIRGAQGLEVRFIYRAGRLDPPPAFTPTGESTPAA